MNAREMPNIYSISKEKFTLFGSKINNLGLKIFLKNF